MASKFIEECRPTIKCIISIYCYVIYVLYDGLVALELAKRSDINTKFKWKKIAEDCIAKLNRMCEVSPDNFLNKIHLLKAEMAVVCGELDPLHHYEKSISLSKKYCFLNEEALACERAGLYFLGSNSKKSFEFFQRSFKCYYLWGARAKMKHIQSTYKNIFNRKFVLHNPSLEEKSLEVCSQSSVSDITNSCSSKSTAVIPCL